MIHVRAQRNEVGATSFASIEALHISLTEQSIREFRTLLQKAMNINYPELPADWRELMDILEFGAKV